MSRKERKRVNRRVVKDAVKYCDVCGVKRELDEHHIGRNRHIEPDNPRRMLYVCRVCHEKVQDEPLDVQLGWVADATARAINRVVGREVL